MIKTTLIFTALALSVSSLFGFDQGAAFHFRDADQLPALCSLGSGRHFRGLSEYVGLASRTDWRGNEQLVLFSRGQKENGGTIELARDESDALLQPARKLTLALRIYPEEVLSTLNALIRITRSTTRPGYYSFHFQASGGDAESRSGTLRFYFRAKEGDEGMQIARSTKPLVIIQQEWVHLAMTFDEGTVTFYVNGEALGDPVALTVDEIPALEPVHPSLFAAAFPGGADELLLLPGVVLNSEQIQALYEQGLEAPEVKSAIP